MRRPRLDCARSADPRHDPPTRGKHKILDGTQAAPIYPRIVGASCGLRLRVCARLRQVCLDGSWVALRGNGMQASDLSAAQLRFNVGAQAEVASAVFAVRLAPAKGDPRGLGFRPRGGNSLHASSR